MLLSCLNIEEIEHALSCLLQNNLRGGEMLFEIEKPRLLYFKQHFDTEEVILQQPREQVLYFYFTMATTLNWSFSSIEERSRSICDVILKQNCRESCSLLQPRYIRNADDWFSLWKEICFILLITRASVYIIY